MVKTQEHVFPLTRSQVQNWRGIEYVCLRRLSSQIDVRRWVPCPTNKGVSYTNLVSAVEISKSDILEIPTALSGLLSPTCSFH